VWCANGGMAGHVVVPPVGEMGHKAIHVCMYVAVSGRCGLIGLRYTTGTEGFPERWPQELHDTASDKAGGSVQRSQLWGLAVIQLQHVLPPWLLFAAATG